MSVGKVLLSFLTNWVVDFLLNADQKGDIANNRTCWKSFAVNQIFTKSLPELYNLNSIVTKIILTKGIVTIYPEN